MTSITLPGQGKSEEPEWVVWLTLIICLLIGWVAMTTVTGRTETVANVAGGSIRIPDKWIKTKEAGAVFAATNLNTGAYGARISVRQITKADILPGSSGEELGTAANNWTLLRSPDLEGYRVLNIEPIKLQGRDAITIEYAYLTDPPEGGSSGGMPALMHAIDTVIASGDSYAILTVAVEQSNDAMLNDLVASTQAGWQIP